MGSHVIYTHRPGGTSLWLPVDLARSLGIAHGDTLTPEQYANASVQELLARRIARKPNDQVE